MKTTDEIMKMVGRWARQCTLAGVTSHPDALEDANTMEYRISKAIHELELKAKSTLANNLCPDHRDKIVGSPCLMCTVEEQRRCLRGELDRYDELRREASYENWAPTAENVNALPEKLREYVYRLETLCDPAGTLRENAIARHLIEAQGRHVEELTAKVQYLVDHWPAPLEGGGITFPNGDVEYRREGAASREERSER